MLLLLCLLLLLLFATFSYLYYYVYIINISNKCQLFLFFHHFIFFSLDNYVRRNTHKSTVLSFFLNHHLVLLLYSNYLYLQPTQPLFFVYVRRGKKGGGIYILYTVVAVVVVWGYFFIIYTLHSHNFTRSTLLSLITQKTPTHTSWWGFLGGW